MACRPAKHKITLTPKPAFITSWCFNHPVTEEPFLLLPSHVPQAYENKRGSRAGCTTRREA